MSDKAAKSFWNEVAVGRKPGNLWGQLYTVVPIVLVLCLAFWGYWIDEPVLEGSETGVRNAIIAAMFLGLIPVLICVVQTTTRQRQLEKLDDLDKFYISSTYYYQAAMKTVESMRPVSADLGYLAPLLIFMIIMAGGFLLIFVGYDSDSFFQWPHVILSGVRLPADTTGKLLSSQDIASHGADLSLVAYQRQTFAVMASAFFGSYVYALGRLLDRVNNSDLYPISPHYYAARAVIACLTAAVFRHTAAVFGVTDTSLLILIGFATGLAPDLLILAMARKAFQAVKIWESRDDPSADYRPTSLPLLMIDDLTKEKVDRLNELGIDSAQCLACQNPFLLWPRLPFDLGLITDWIAQGQLYALVRDEKLAKLRQIFVADIFDLYTRLKDPQAAPAICTLIGFDPGQVTALCQQIEDDQSFRRLREVRDAMHKRPDGTEI